MVYYLALTFPQAAVLISGMIGNNSCGARSLIYGKTVDNILELQVVLVDGQLINTSSLDVDAYQKHKQTDLGVTIYSTISEPEKNRMRFVLDSQSDAKGFRIQFGFNF